MTLPANLCDFYFTFLKKIKYNMLIYIYVFFKCPGPRALNPDSALYCNKYMWYNNLPNCDFC